MVLVRMEADPTENEYFEAELIDFQEINILNSLFDILYNIVFV